MAASVEERLAKVESDIASIMTALAPHQRRIDGGPNDENDPLPICPLSGDV